MKNKDFREIQDFCNIQRI